MWRVLTTFAAKKTLLFIGLLILAGWVCVPSVSLEELPLLAFRTGDDRAQISLEDEGVTQESPATSPVAEVADPMLTSASSAVATHEPAQNLAGRILQLALHQAVWGPPAWCDVRQQVDMFHQQLSAFGDFIREGQGSGKLKMKLQCPAGDTMNSLLQISDGQRLQTIENWGEVRQRTEVDLVKVRDRLVINDQSYDDPTVTLYLAIGGQAESLRKLYQQYEWYAVNDGRYGEIDVWLLEGRLSVTLPPPQVFALTDQRLRQECASGLLPTSVRVAIGKANSELPHWLYQVEHRTEARPEDPISEGAPLRLVTEWSNPRRMKVAFRPGTFDASSSNDPWIEETEDYLPPVPTMAQRPSSIPFEEPKPSLR